MEGARSVSELHRSGCYGTGLAASFPQHFSTKIQCFSSADLGRPAKAGLLGSQALSTEVQRQAGSAGSAWPGGGRASDPRQGLTLSWLHLCMVPPTSQHRRLWTCWTTSPPGTGCRTPQTLRERPHMERMQGWGKNLWEPFIVFLGGKGNSYVWESTYVTLEYKTVCHVARTLTQVFLEKKQL